MALELLVNKSELRSSVSGSTPKQKVRPDGMVTGRDSRHGNRYREADDDALRAKIPSIFAKFVSSRPLNVSFFPRKSPLFSDSSIV